MFYVAEGGMGSTVPCGAQLGQGSSEAMNPTTNSVGDLRSPEEFGAALRSKPLLRGKLTNDSGLRPTSFERDNGMFKESGNEWNVSCRRSRKETCRENSEERSPESFGVFSVMSEANGGK